jgi:serine/threonine protein kinase
MAPEVWNEEDYDYFADSTLFSQLIFPVFSFGMVLYEMLSLKRPFEAQKGHPQTYIVSGQFPKYIVPLTDPTKSAFVELKSIYEKCLNVNKQSRPKLSELKTFFSNLKTSLSIENKENLSHGQ